MRDVIVGRPALIVIDMQKGGLQPVEVSGIPHMPGYQDRIDRVVTLVETCRRSGVPVIFFQEVHRRDLVDFGRELDGAEGIHSSRSLGARERSILLGPRWALEGDRGTGLVDELQRGPGDYFIAKRRYSCFIGTDFDVLLRGLRVETLLLVGGLTNVCVHYTFADAHQRDYHVRVLEDCVGGSSLARHDAALDAMEYLQAGARRTSAEVLETLREMVPA